MDSTRDPKIITHVDSWMDRGLPSTTLSPILAIGTGCHPKDENWTMSLANQLTERRLRLLHVDRRRTWSLLGDAKGEKQGLASFMPRPPLTTPRGLTSYFCECDSCVGNATCEQRYATCLVWETLAASESSSLSRCPLSFVIGKTRYLLML